MYVDCFDTFPCLPFVHIPLPPSLSPLPSPSHPPPTPPPHTKVKTSPDQEGDNILCSENMVVFIGSVFQYVTCLLAQPQNSTPGLYRFHPVCLIELPAAMEPTFTSPSLTSSYSEVVHWRPSAKQENPLFLNSQDCFCHGIRRYEINHCSPCSVYRSPQVKSQGTQCLPGQTVEFVAQWRFE